MAWEAHADWPLIDVVAVPADDPEHPVCVDRSTTAAAYTSTGREVEFGFEKPTVSKGIWWLHASNLETLDPYGGDPIQSIAEAACTHEGLVLLRLHTPHRSFPTDYFVYGCNACGRHGPWVDRLPVIEPLIHSTRSIGLLRTGDDYVVANLRRQQNTRTRRLEMFLDCYCSRNKEWRQRQVNLSFPDPEGKDYLWGWKTDRVIPFNKTLLWIDLSRGILLCRDLLSSSGGNDIELKVVPHPPRLLPDNDQRWQHPQPFWSVGCCSGKLKLISLQSVHGGDAREVRTWTLDWDALEWNEEPSTSLNYTRLRNDMESKLQPDDKLPSFEDNSPCYPVLSTDQSNILYLTLATQNTAWLLQIDMHTCTLDDIADYPRFRDHMNPPYPTDLSKYLNTRSEGDQCSNHPIPTDAMDQQNHPIPTNAMDQQHRQLRRRKRHIGRPPKGELRYSKRLRASSLQSHHVQQEQQKDSPRRRHR